MTASPPLAASQCITLGRRALHTLRASLERDTGLQSASYLQEAGFAGGEELYQAFMALLRRDYQVEQPGQLDVSALGEVLSRFFRESGWGTLLVSPLAPSVMALDSSDWSEADPQAGAQYPSCHLSSGLFADFLGRVSGAQIGVMEVECVSRGDARCRFLAGAPETLQMLYDRMSQGEGYPEVLGLPG